MKILFIVKEFPHSKVIGGPIIIYNRVKYLSRNNTVSLLAFAENPTEEQIESVSPFCAEVGLVPCPPPRSVLRKAFDFIKSTVPPYFLACYSEEMYAKLREMTGNIDYDVVISEYSMVAQYLYRNPDLRGVKRVMSVHEVYYFARKKVFRMQRWSREGFRALCFLKGLKRFEFDMYSDADKVLTLTGEDAEALLSVKPGLDISVVPHGVDVEKFSPGEREPGPPAVMFLGNYPHEPNREAAVFFASRVWPKIKERVPYCRLLLVGRGPSDEMVEMASKDPSILITGEVSEVLPYFRQSDVFVCPVRIGGGFRGKVLEAMACGVPVVSTPLGAEGLPARDGENILLAESADELAEKTVAILTDPALGERLALNARRLVVDHFSWQRGVEILEGVLEDVVGGGGA